MTILIMTICENKLSRLSKNKSNKMENESNKNI